MRAVSQQCLYACFHTVIVLLRDTEAARCLFCCFDCVTVLCCRRGSVLYQFNALFDGSLTDEEISQIGQSLNQAITDNGNVLTVNSQQAPVTNLQFAPSSNLNNLRRRHVFFAVYIH